MNAEEIGRFVELEKRANVILRKVGYFVNFDEAALTEDEVKIVTEYLKTIGADNWIRPANYYGCEEF